MGVVYTHKRESKEKKKKQESENITFHELSKYETNILYSDASEDYLYN